MKNSCEGVGLFLVELNVYITYVIFLMTLTYACMTGRLISSELGTLM